MKLAWSNLARRELESLHQYSVQKWGVTVTRRYLEDVRYAARAAADRPEKSRVLRGDFRIQRVRSHYLVLYIDVMLQRVTVARILHAAMGIKRHLPMG